MAVKQLIERVELTSSASSITFSSIPQDYDHLVVYASVRGDGPGTGELMFLDINGGSTAISSRGLEGFVSAGSFTATGQIATIPPNDAVTANTFGSVSIYIANYKASNNKSMSVDSVTENNDSFANRLLLGALWQDTSAITSLSFRLNGDNFVANSSISLYGITRGGSGTVTTA